MMYRARESPSRCQDSCTAYPPGKDTNPPDFNVYTIRRISTQMPTQRSSTYQRIWKLQTTCYRKEY